MERVLSQLKKIDIMSNAWIDLIVEGCEKNNVPISHGMVIKMQTYATELLKWNRKTNLTAITNPFEVAVKHFIDSLLVSKYIKPGRALLDMGSGAGFPGIPLKLYYPDLSVTLIDSSRKRVSFQKHIIRQLDLERINPYHIRAEDFIEKTDMKFDYVISRAFTNFNDFIMLALPYLKENGIIIAMKGKLEAVDSEKSTIEKLEDIVGLGDNRMNVVTHEYKLPYINSSRSVFIVKQVI